jgi:hypothetical protein
MFSGSGFQLHSLNDVAENRSPPGRVVEVEGGSKST